MLTVGLALPFAVMAATSAFAGDKKEGGVVKGAAKGAAVGAVLPGVSAKTGAAVGAVSGGVKASKDKKEEKKKDLVAWAKQAEAHVEPWSPVDPASARRTA